MRILSTRKEGKRAILTTITEFPTRLTKRPIMENLLTLPCPDCQTKIPFKPEDLLRGVQLTCPNCGISMGLSQQSMDTTREAMDKFNELKQNIKDRK